MSHSHSHSEGDGHSHSHSQPPQAVLAAALPSPSDVDGLITIHSLSITNPNEPLNLTVSATDSNDADLAKELAALTILARDFARQKIAVPPPPATTQNQRSTLIMQAKEEGNTLYKSKKFAEAAAKYSIALQLANTRPLFEAAVYSREELTLALSNRCAALIGQGKLVEALADAEAVIKIKRPWTKGHFRKGRCLAAMGRLEEAKEAFLFGLEFEPGEKELTSALDDIKRQIREQQEANV